MASAKAIRHRYTYVDHCAGKSISYSWEWLDIVLPAGKHVQGHWATLTCDGTIAPRRCYTLSVSRRVSENLDCFVKRIDI